ncbi:hypothetical protein D7X88_08395 [bacterium C-53]|nr:hypothetical protein [Lachnospiraceae bacterium]NBI02125.1 hypothetical protein [Lachnospiraceae bacterium]RKJ10385.1 hypothetical protein D7X88_08395 [bacterium C-53]
MKSILLTGWESVWQFFCVLLIFIFVLAVTYITTRFIGNYQKAQIFNRNIEVIETFRVTTNKYLQIVRTADKYLVIAVCKDTITMLTELSEDSIEKLPDKGMLSETESFQAIMEKARKIIPKK